MAKLNLREVGLVLGYGTGCRAEEVAIVGEDKRRHDGIEVDDTQYLTAILGEQHIIHFRVAMTDALREFTLASKTLRLGHGLGTLAKLL